MTSITCNNSECGFEIYISINELERVGFGASGNHTEWIKYNGRVVCPQCKHEQNVEFLVDECDETGDVLDIIRIV